MEEEVKQAEDVQKDRANSLVRMQSRNRYSVYEMMPGNETKTERVKGKVTFDTHTHTPTHNVYRCSKTMGLRTHTHTLTHNPSFHEDSIFKCVFLELSCRQPFGHTPFLSLHPKCPE